MENRFREIEIVVNESDNLLDVLLSNGLDIRFFKGFLKTVGAKANNSKIGFARIDTDKETVKIFVCPKLFGRDKDKLLSYYNMFFGLVLKHPDLVRYFNIESNGLVFIPNASTNKFANFDDIVSARSIHLLDGILKYFKSFKSNFSSKLNYYSGTLDYELDIEKSLADPMKFNIHQKKKVDTIDKRQALVILSGLKIIIKEHPKQFSIDFLDEVKKVAKFISGKFFLRNGFLSKREILDKKSYGIFKKNKEKEVYNHMLSLLGLDDFFSNETSERVSVFSKLKTSQFFLEANMLFEVFVYDQLVSIHGADRVHFKSNSLPFYFRNSSGEVVKKLSANPDFVVELSESERVVIDAKWKILKDIDSVFTSDFLKLSRDSHLVGTDTGWLVYPSVRNKKLLEQQPFSSNIAPGFSSLIREMPLNI